MVVSKKGQILLRLARRRLEVHGGGLHSHEHPDEQNYQVPLTPVPNVASPSNSRENRQVWFNDERPRNRVSWANKCSESCIGESVMDIFKRSPYSYSFREAYRIFRHCNVDVHFDIIKRTTLGYSFKIYGLPECPSEDLYLAVYIFLEEVFGIESKLELCAWVVENDDRNVVGVVLDSTVTRNRIFMKADCLNGTDLKLKPNFELNWILDGLCQKGYV